jgi:hypothetical protein
LFLDYNESCFPKILLKSPAFHRFKRDLLSPCVPLPSACVPPASSVSCTSASVPPASSVSCTSASVRLPLPCVPPCRAFPLPPVCFPRSVSSAYCRSLLRVASVSPSYPSYSLPAPSASSYSPCLFLSPTYYPHYHKNKTTNQRKQSFYFYSFEPTRPNPYSHLHFSHLQETAKNFQTCSPRF